MKIKSLAELLLFSLPIKESEIIEVFPECIPEGGGSKDHAHEAGQETRFKAFVAIGDYSGHIGLCVKYSKEVDTAV
jgi:small subunit ribosomal protein S2e